MRLIGGFLLAMAIATAGFAVEPDEVVDDPALEARARAISAELRCMVCQNQSIDDSNAPLARDLRILVRERLVAGDSDEAVVAYLVDRYGEFILLRPTFTWHNWLLWTAPFIGLGLGAAVLAVAVGRRRRPALPPLDSDEQQRLDKLLAETPTDGARRSNLTQ